MRPLVIFLFIFISLTLYAQDTIFEIKVVKPSTQGMIFTVVDQMPQFPGGEDSMKKFIQKNIKYPDLEREGDIQGIVVVGFIVNEDGSLSDITIKKAVSAGINKEALRVVKMLPKFIPGKRQGVPVRVQFFLPLAFRLAVQ